jgi:hypothetical protein
VFAEAIVRLQAVLADALMARDPAAFVRDAAAKPGAAPELRAIDADGLRIAVLLVAKLRFQRLMNASRMASEWFERDGAGFTAAFKRYHHEVPPEALDPWGERDQFEAWCARQSV